LSTNDSLPTLNLLVLASRLFIAILFLQTGAFKLLRLHDFATVISNFRLMPDALVGSVARLIAAAEIVVGVLMVLHVAFADPLAFGMVATFSAAVAVNLARGRTGIDCGCLGFARLGRIGYPLLIRNGLLLALILFGMIVEAHSSSRLTSLHDARSFVAAAFIAVVMLICIWVIEMTWRLASATSLQQPGNRE